MFSRIAAAIAARQILIHVHSQGNGRRRENLFYASPRANNPIERRQETLPGSKTTAIGGLAFAGKS
jgi:hypothetical protein